MVRAAGPRGGSDNYRTGHTILQYLTIFASGHVCRRSNPERRHDNGLPYQGGYADEYEGFKSSKKYTYTRNLASSALLYTSYIVTKALRDPPAFNPSVPSSSAR